MDWSKILADAGISEPPGYRETVEEMRAPGYESEAARYSRLREEERQARLAATNAAKKRGRR